MKKTILEQLALQGTSAAGVVRARRLSELREILKNRGSVSLCEPDIEKRIDPFLLMPEVKSIIVCLFSYCLRQNTKISEYAMGLDYHTVIKSRLGAVSEFLKDKGYLSEVYVDNTPLPDRYLAYLAGLGFFGKNGMLINEKYGSKVFIGYIMTDCELEADKSCNNAYCIGCNKCIAACPGGAIGENFGFDENKCVSFLTQKKGELTKGEAEIIKKSGYVWGCDICQNVCPYNYTAPLTELDEFCQSIIRDISIDDDMTNREFRERYGNRAFAWRGRAVLKRIIDLYKGHL